MVVAPRLPPIAYIQVATKEQNEIQIAPRYSEDAPQNLHKIAILTGVGEHMFKIIFHR